MARSNIKSGKATAGSPHPIRSPNRPTSLSTSTDPSESSLKNSLMTGQVTEHPAGTDTSPNASLDGRGGGGGGFVGVSGGEIGGMGFGLSPSDKRDIASESEPASESVSAIPKKYIHPEVSDTKSSPKDSNINVVIRSKGTTNELSTPIVSPTTAAHADALLNTINAITDTSSALLSTTQRLTHATSSNISETNARESAPQKKNINFYDNSAFTSEIISGEGGGMEDLACLPSYPITKEHLPPNWNLEQRVLHPGTPRANAAVSAERPDGSVIGFDPSLTVLQQHVKFWDTNDKGVIYPSDTFTGFRRLGFGYIISAAAVLVIHGTFSYPTQKSFIPNPFFPIYLDRIHRTKHGSDSEVIDTEGRFIPQKFEEIFSKYDKGNKGGLSWSDIQEMVYGSMNVMDFVGWTASRLEWWTTFLLLKDQRGVVSKERIRGLYDGTVFQQVAAEVERRKNLVKED